MDTKRINAKNVKMVAHRGMSGLERENTCPAFIAAANRTYFGIETDVHVTKDGKFVIIHDETTDRVSGGAVSVNVEESDYAELETILLPDSDGSTLRQDIRIPLLSEYIHICKKYGKVSVLEVKNEFTKEQIFALVEEISAFDYLEGTIFISFQFANCKNLRALLPEAKIQWLTKEAVSEERLSELAEHRLDIDIYHKMLTKERVEEFHRRGMKVNCWTCDNAEDAARLIEYGVDFITTNILE